MNKQDWYTHIAMRQRMGLDVGADWFQRLPDDQKQSLWYSYGHVYYWGPDRGRFPKWCDVWRDLSGLHPMLRHYENQRVEVRWEDGEVERFQVGRSSGWRPCTLAMATRASRDGYAVSPNRQIAKLEVIPLRPRKWERRR